MKTIKHFVIENYIREVQLTKTRRKKYYVKGEKIPKKYSDAKRFEFRFRGTNECIYDIQLKDFPLRNATTCLKPRMKRIQGQELHQLTMLPNHRGRIIESIKEEFDKVLTRGVIKTFPIGIQFTYLSSRSEMGEDLDNHRLFYEKAIIDKLRMIENLRFGQLKKNHKGCLPDDNVDYVVMLNSNWFESKKRRIIVELIIFENGEREQQVKRYESLS